MKSRCRWIIIGVLMGFVSNVFGETIIVDHTCTDLTQIPQSAIQTAKDTLHIAYGHTSHGSQLTTGMSGMVDFINGGGLGLLYPENFFAWNNGGSGGALDLHDYAMGGDVGYYPDWVNNTISYLDNPANADVNVIIWSWCGQASSRTEQTMIDTYLAPMTQLELTYPHVTFVYMTGHADGTGETGNLHLRNQQIREYCIQNGKVLYDFYDIECYDPDGSYFGDKLVNDNCDYDSDGDGSRDSNWAIEWQNAHTEGIDWYTCSSAHSQPLNANRKAYAAWWLWARLAGWDTNPCLPAPGELTADYDDNTGQVYLNWQDNSSSPAEDAFVIQRQVDSDAWDNEYASVDPNIATFIETLTLDGIYRYRIVALLNDDGGGSPCTSSTSNTVTVTVDHSAPEAPTNLQYVILGGTDIQLTWTDNSDNEDGFTIERSVDSAAFEVLNDAIASDTVTYTDIGAVVNHTYAYRVKAGNSYGDSDYTDTVTVDLYQGPPNAPSNLEVQLTAGNTIALNWADNSDNEDGFILERQIDSGPYEVLDDSIAVNTASYSDTDLIGGYTYTYRLYAYNTYGDSAYSNAASEYVPLETFTVLLDTTSEIEDSFLFSAYPDETNGSVSYPSRDIENYIVRFNLPEELTGKNIISAELGLYIWSVDYSADQYMQVYRVTRDWEENTTTWNTASPGVSWTTPGGDYDPEVIADIPIQNIDHAYISPRTDVASVVQKWVLGYAENHGLMIVNDSSASLNLKASEYSSGHTYLEITYDNSCPCDWSADFNNDCQVNLHDASELAFYWQGYRGDLDIAPAGGNGIVDIDDFLEMISQWLIGCP